MTALSAMQSAAMRLAGVKPSTFFASNDKLETELVDLINEVATYIVQAHAWRSLTKIHTVTGDGVTTDFNLPPDYSYMPTGAGIQGPTNWFWGYRNLMDMGEWIEFTGLDFAPLPGGWISFGGQLHFAPAPNDGAQAAFPYISNLSVIDKFGQPAAAFEDDEDAFVLPERLLTLGLIWKWNEQKFNAAPADQANFEKALSEYAGRDGGAFVMRRNSISSFSNAVNAWPWELG